MNAWILFAFVFVFAIDTEIITDGNVPVAGKAFTVVSTVLKSRIPNPNRVNPYPNSFIILIVKNR